MPAPPQMNNGETSNEEGESTSSDESESSSMAPAAKKKGDKPHPLRQWAEQGE